MKNRDGLANLDLVLDLDLDLDGSRRERPLAWLVRPSWSQRETLERLVQVQVQDQVQVQVQEEADRPRAP